MEYINIIVVKMKTKKIVIALTIEIENEVACPLWVEILRFFANISLILQKHLKPKQFILTNQREKHPNYKFAEW